MSGRCPNPRRNPRCWGKSWGGALCGSCAVPAEPVAPAPRASSRHPCLGCGEEYSWQPGPGLRWTGLCARCQDLVEQECCTTAGCGVRLGEHPRCRCPRVSGSQGRHGLDCASCCTVLLGPGHLTETPIDGRCGPCADSVERLAERPLARVPVPW